MKRNVGATIILLGSLGTLCFGLWAMLQADFASIVILSNETDASEWLFHWRLAAACWAIVGLAGAASAIALLRRKRWSMALLGIVSASSVFFDVASNLVGYAKYPFEAIDPIQIILLGLLAATSIAAYLRWNAEMRP